jgi:hypothetical protein
LVQGTGNAAGAPLRTVVFFITVFMGLCDVQEVCHPDRLRSGSMVHLKRIPRIYTVVRFVIISGSIMTLFWHPSFY